MNKVIDKKLLSNLVLLLAFTNYTWAETSLPVSSQTQKETKQKVEKIELLQEIKIEAQSTTTPSNPQLKTGDACSDEELEELEKLEEAEGELFVEIPMAKTIPCDTVDCKDLKPAKMIKDNYEELKTAKTISSCKK